MLDIVLQPYPTTREVAVDALTLSIARTAGAVRLDYRLRGQLADLRIPAFTCTHREDRLWEHTCFELFARGANDEPYCELNVAPSGAWAAYAFSSYRTGMRPIESFAPTIEVARSDDAELRVRVAIDLTQLDAAFTRATLRLAPSAVIENMHEQRSYWAAHHAADKPDFHHAGAFAVTLPPSS